jgi:hypothetical protein
MKECPFCSAQIKEEIHKCHTCGKTLMKDLEMNLTLRASGYPMRPYQRHRRHRYRIWLTLFAGLVLTLLIAVGGTLELLSASLTDKATGSVSLRQEDIVTPIPPR